MARQQESSNTPLALRDRLRTPDFVFYWISQYFDFKIDLSADSESTKCPMFFDEKTNALKQSWHKVKGDGFCNPPYSKPKVWLEKAWHEARCGFRSVFLIPTPNGEDAYRDHVFGNASEIIFINGRISFIAPEDFTIKGKNDKPDRHFKKGDPMTGNTRGSCFVIYGRKHAGHTRTSWVNRDDMEAEYQAFLERQAAA